jgi:hypothetical protein
MIQNLLCQLGTILPLRQQTRTGVRQKLGIFTQLARRTDREIHSDASTALHGGTAALRSGSWARALLKISYRMIDSTNKALGGLSSGSPPSYSKTLGPVCREPCRLLQMGHRSRHALQSKAAAFLCMRALACILRFSEPSILHRRLSPRQRRRKEGSLLCKRRGKKDSLWIHTNGSS